MICCPRIADSSDLATGSPVSSCPARTLPDLPVLTENSVGCENAEVTIIRGSMVATMMSSLFIALFAFVASSFWTRGALQAEILALRHQLAVLQKTAPRLTCASTALTDCCGFCYRDSGPVGAAAC